MQSGEVQASCVKFPYLFPMGDPVDVRNSLLFKNDQINTVLLSAIRRDSCKPVQALNKKNYEAVIRGVSDLSVPIS